MGSIINTNTAAQESRIPYQGYEQYKIRTGHNVPQQTIRVRVIEKKNMLCRQKSSVEVDQIIERQNRLQITNLFQQIQQITTQVQLLKNKYQELKNELDHDQFYKESSTMLKQIEILLIKLVQIQNQSYSREASLIADKEFKELKLMQKHILQCQQHINVDNEDASSF